MTTFIQDPLFIIALGIVFVVGGIIGLRLHPFLALIGAAFAVALCTPESSLLIYASGKGLSADAARELVNTPIGVRIASEFGRTCGKIGILIAMASIIGKCLLESGGAERIVRSAMRCSGEKYAPASFLVSSFFIGIPVFFDTVFYLMVPLAKATAMKIGKNYLLLILSITAGAAMANSLVPPTPGPLFLSSALNIPIGMMMVAGTLVGLTTIIAGYAYAVWANKKWPIPLKDSVDAPLQQIEAIASQDENQLPALWLAVMPILIPVVLIGTKSLLSAYPMQGIDSGIIRSVFDVVHVFGEKNLAIILGACAALIMLSLRHRGNRGAMLDSVQSALTSAGAIILITSAGGAFGGMLQQTGIAARIGELTTDYQMALIPLAFLITAVVRTAQGSATVAMITASGILAGMANSASLEYHQLYIGLAIACGSKPIPWMNDSGFWIICKMSNLSEKEVLKTFSPMLTLMGIVGLIVVVIGAHLFPLV
jgi:GntP family gluconate:H+ symporter